eukprot:CAMPEP_0204532580 /NCGR_PEP_ID=MMETSP0661-20131031/11805_1 /ASSEMBLY_ACC=CAM_ASM_000606 /TAXON_ID=109239 /ORGANISM="Alexandrium margalefi, Strain AMGDE01CS-322" /LENGTH=149 /DNA_ID=CAMNT_0051538839 /DNA_START=78 /DNA_END=525 /DNA_ORIENTATION=+
MALTMRGLLVAALLAWACGPLPASCSRGMDVRVHEAEEEGLQAGMDVTIAFGRGQIFKFHDVSGQTYGQILRTAYADAARSRSPLPPGLVLRTLGGSVVNPDTVVPAGGGTLTLQAVQHERGPLGSPIPISHRPAATPGDGAAAGPAAC